MGTTAMIMVILVVLITVITGTTLYHSKIHVIITHITRTEGVSKNQ